MFDRFGYKSALYLSTLIAAVHGSFFIYLLSYSSAQANRVAIYVVAAILILTGLWLLSRVGRYAGALYYALCAGTAAFALLGSFKVPVIWVGTVWVVAMGILSLGNTLILTLSKSFAVEFEAEREKRPAYKKRFLKILAVLIGLCAAAATYNDIVNLASK